jgi:hypothetical protein
MLMKWKQAAFFLVGLAAIGSAGVYAQVGAAVEAVSRTDVAGSLYGAFSGTTTGEWSNAESVERRWRPD